MGVFCAELLVYCPLLSGATDKNSLAAVDRQNQREAAKLGRFSLQRRAASAQLAHLPSQLAHFPVSARF